MRVKIFAGLLWPLSGLERLLAGASNEKCPEKPVEWRSTVSAPCQAAPASDAAQGYAA